MGITLFIGPLVDEAGEEEYVAQGRALLADLNAQLAAQGLPPYRDAESTEENSPYWSTMFGNACLGYLHVVLASLREDESLNLPLPQFLDPTFHTIRYIPLDFTEPIACKVKGEEAGEMPPDEAESLEDEVFFGSCQALRREIEQVAAWLEIPLDRFPLDESGDGSDVEPAWSAVIDELEGQGARCMRLQWQPLDTDGALEQARAFCDMTGIPFEQFIETIKEQHGSVEEFVASQREAEPTPEEKSASVIVALVNHYHACQVAIEQNLAFQIA